MLKNIIVLALCFMAYIIGNIYALSALQRKSHQSYKVETGFDENGEIVPTANNIQFENDEALDSFRSEFFKDFVQKGNQEEFQAQIDDLNEKRKKDEFFVCKLFSSMIYNNYNSILMPL
ncbi:uncharacterized protein LOC100570234 isoform X5 [Acyrthosiphon pisum]|uniref:Uncharacterized protein n=1 Tax=Acyrthosiphon pisum TaxID=7029 RepID=A0A8R2JSG0_ACYPI|nr:uncharacterized protein LOC100570234 isoform X5 [Acyrthosiphon pisum]